MTVQLRCSAPQFSIGSSQHPFVLNEWFEDLGYSRVEHAKYALKQGFKENDDYLINPNVRENSNGFTGLPAKVGRPEETVKMTFDCFIKFASISVPVLSTATLKPKPQQNQPFRQP